MSPGNHFSAITLGHQILSLEKLNQETQSWECVTLTEEQWGKDCECLELSSLEMTFFPSFLGCSSLIYKKPQYPSNKFNFLFKQTNVAFIIYKKIYIFTNTIRGFPGGSEVKASAWNAGDPGLIPGLRRFPGEGNGTPLQYSCLENPMDGGAW